MHRSSFGHHLYGLEIAGLGLSALIWPDYKDWDLLRSVLNATDGPVFVYVTAAAQMFGGVAIQFRPTARVGASVLGIVNFALALMWLPGIISAPQVYNNWGNFFEQFSLAAGAAIVYARLSPAWLTETVTRIGRILVGICVVSFTLEQAFYLNNTAVLVPAWLPPSRIFWALATTVAFGAAAIALLTNRMANLAARLLTMMLLTFGVVVWIPLLLSNPRAHGTWSETLETFAIAGAAWILADTIRKNSAD